MRAKGTIVHYCFESLFKEYTEEIGSLNFETINTATERYIKSYFESTGVSFEAIGNMNNAVISSIKSAVVDLAIHMNNEFAQSGFRPVACELKIGKYDAEIEPISVKADNGCDVVVSGFVDRVDKYGPYIRVIDYKTGTKIFNLSETFYGLNLQMLIYLYSIVKNGSGIFKNSIPAGVLYFHAQRKYSENSVDKMNGLLLDDINVLNEMEKDLKGNLIPVSLKKDGTFTANSSVISKEQFDIIFKYIDKILKNVGNDIYDGNIDISPLKVKNIDGCKYCEYRSVCKWEKDIIDDDMESEQSISDKNAVIEKMKDITEGNNVELQ